MTTTEDRLAQALESAIEDLEFRMDAASIDFDVYRSPNASQRVVVFAEGERLAYVTVEPSWDGEADVFVDIYGVAPDGTECRMCGDLSVDAAISYIINARTSEN